MTVESGKCFEAIGNRQEAIGERCRGRRLDGPHSRQPKGEGEVKSEELGVRNEERGVRGEEESRYMSF